MTSVTQSTREVTPAPTPERPAKTSRDRVGDRVFSGLATGSGIFVIGIFAEIAVPMVAPRSRPATIHS